jgi:hypothetical protein
VQLTALSAFLKLSVTLKSLGNRSITVALDGLLRSTTAVELKSAFASASLMAFLASADAAAAGMLNTVTK